MSTGAPPIRIVPVSAGQHAGKNVDERRLAGAVLADEAVGLARAEVERHVVEGDARRKRLPSPRTSSCGGACGEGDGVGSMRT